MVTENSKSFRNIWVGIAGALVFISGTAMIHSPKGLLSIILLVGGTLLSYYGIKVLIRDSVDTLFISIIVLVGLSFVKSAYQHVATVAFLLLAFIICLKELSVLKKQLTSDYVQIASLELKDILAWVFIFILTLFYGISNKNGFWCVENQAIYELSVGHSYSISILNPPDLSYAGKTLRYHFLSTRIPLYFSNIFNVSILESAYFITPLWFTIVTFILIQALFAKYPLVRLPVFYLLFMPLFSWGLFYWEGLMNRTLLSVSGSYILPFLLVTIAIDYLISRRYVGLILCGSMLILTKASYFLVLLGGIILFLGRNREYKRMSIILSIILPIFLISYVLFLSGAHQHNHWILFPTVLYDTYVYSSPLTFFVWAILSIITLVSYIKKHNNILLGFSSISLSGILGSLILTELTESNSVQFLTAAYLSTVVIFWSWFNNFMSGKSLFGKRLGVFFLNLLVIVTFLSVVQGPWVNFFNFLPSTGPGAVLSKNISEEKGSRQEKPAPYLSQDLIDAYVWINQNIPPNKVILFGKQYEVFAEAFAGAKSWWPYTGFARSALSARQMYCENSKYKSIGMEKDFPFRFAGSIYFYAKFVNCSEQSQRIISLFFDPEFGKTSAIPFSAPPVLRPTRLKIIAKKIFYYIGFKKEWSWLNRAGQVDYEIKNYLKAFDPSKNWAVNFIETSGIDYIVLENHDMPSAFLKEITRQVYANNSIIILEVKKSSIAQLQPQSVESL